MAEAVFTVLYTHQKTKKSKVWQDGILKISAGGNQAALYNDKGQRLDTVFIKNGKVNPGDDLESDRYLITVEAEGGSNTSSDNSTGSEDVSIVNRSGPKPVGLRPPAGLKRKFAGFQCPRDVPKKPCVEVEDTGRTCSSQVAQRSATPTSQFFITSPLFAVSHMKKTDSGVGTQWGNSKQASDFSSTSEKHSTVSWTNQQINGNTAPSNYSFTKEQSAEDENSAKLNVPVSGSTTKNFRSKAQILALLKAQPDNEVGSGNLGNSSFEDAPAKLSNGLQRFTGTDSANSALLESESICRKPPAVAINPVKSRWNVYLDESQNPKPDLGDSDDTLMLDGSLDKGFTNYPVSCSLKDGRNPEEIKDPWHSEAEKPHRNELTHMSTLLPNSLSNKDKPCENSCYSELDHREPTIPYPCSPSHTPDKPDLDDLVLEHEQGESYSEVTFNLMDSFDLTELDDEDTELASCLPQSGATLEKDVKVNQENTSLENKTQNCSEDTNMVPVLFVENVKTETVGNGTPSMSTDATPYIVDSSSTDHTVSNELAENGDCDQGSKAIENQRDNLLSNSGKILPLNDEGCVLSGQSLEQLAHHSQWGDIPSDEDELFECIDGCSPDQTSVPATESFHQKTNCNEKKSPGLYSSSSISLLKSLTKPDNALESLSALKQKFPTAEKRDYEPKICLQRGSQEGFHRSRPVEMSLVSFEDVPAVRSVSAAVHEANGIQTMHCPHSVFPQLTPPVFQETPPVVTTPVMNSPGTAPDKTFCEYNGLSQTTTVHHVQPVEGDILSSGQWSPPRWSLGTQGSESDWEFSQWVQSCTMETHQQNSDKLNHPGFLRTRHCITVESPASQLNDFMKTNKISRVQSRLHKGVLAVDTDGNRVDDRYDVPKMQHQNSLLSDYDFLSTIPTGRDDNGDHPFVQSLAKDPTPLELPTVVSAKKQSSKWLKYQDTCSENMGRNGEKNNDFCAQSVFRKPRIDKIQDGYAIEAAKMPRLQLSDDKLGNQNDAGSNVELIAKVLIPANGSLPRTGRKSLHTMNKGDDQIVLSCEMVFPPKHIVLSASVPKRRIHIPAVFMSSAHYKQVFSATLSEHLNVIMFELSQRLHKAFSKVDMSFYTSSGVDDASKDRAAPLCQHKQPSKLVMVKKEGANKGRFFYTCDAPKADQCKFFKWLDEIRVTQQERGKPESRLVMGDMKSLSNYIRCQNIKLYEESQLIIRKISAFPKRQFGKFAKVVNGDAEFGGETKTKLYLKLSRRETSSAYNKDDLWVVSKTLNFDPTDTFIACSVFFGPSASNDIEISPLKGYCPSNWPTNVVVHALLVCNASTELTCLKNIQEHFNASTLPVMPHLLTMPSESEQPSKVSKGKFKPPAVTAKSSNKCEVPDYDFVMTLAKDMIEQFHLNEDQATALMQIAHMMCGSEGPQKRQSPPITIIHGVFGAGKSYLLAVVVLFLVQLFETFDPSKETSSSRWKLLISSSTNVAVDRVLLGLLDLGFEQFIRVGSIRKIAKPILPHSLHTGSENESEQLKELLALLKEDLTPGEKSYVRKSIEQHKLGTNKTLLGQVRVVGVTCAACPFPCMSNLKFPVVVLDECSQMTEPASLLPIARFQCEKLILVGDPKQLSPTIQGSEPAHEYGLEQTLFNRLCLMGHRSVMLRTQYRCHPVISAVANELFYEGHLLNGVLQEDRRPLLEWLPPLCFYNANGTEQVEGNNSFYNMEEANFTVKLIQSLIASGIQGCMIGVITLYKSQMTKICSLFNSTVQCDPSEVKAVQVSTVDAFQGAEKEIIILSCVRTRQVGFIDSEKRMNVALTRGKRHLLIVGSLACLRNNKLWEQVIHHCEKQINGLKHVSQWDEKLNNILKLYQEKKEEELSNTQLKHFKGKAGR
ncbi:5'-3' DNA helicase ZGRF1 isoform X2 [Hyperolius riggenbachi]|uniref:5'-3' DNA helicase ZGRF1 isoform X2 n=1 Tax=Hyperolius riggenbachi TaxID=752182 RepID=UPI0035A38916